MDRSPHFASAMKGRNDETLTLLKKPHAMHFVEWFAKVLAGSLAGFVLKEFIFNPNRKAIEHVFFSNILVIFVSFMLCLLSFLYLLHYNLYVLPRSKLASNIFFLVNVSTPRNVSIAPRRTKLSEIGFLPKFQSPQQCVVYKTPRKRSKTPDSNRRKKNRRNSSSGGKKRGNGSSASKLKPNTGGKSKLKRSSTPPRIVITNDAMWGDYIGKPLNEDTIQKIRWIDPNTIEEEEYYKLLAYGKFVAVKRQSGRKVVIGRIESNFNGKPLREWNNYDVYQWLNSRVNIRCFPSILSVLSNRGPQLLIDLEWLRKNLNEADFKTLEMELHKCFEFEIKKESRETNSYFR